MQPSETTDAAESNELAKDAAVGVSERDVDSDPHPTTNDQRQFVRCRSFALEATISTFDPTAAGVDAVRPSLPDALAVFRPAGARGLFARYEAAQAVV